MIDVNERIWTERNGEVGPNLRIPPNVHSVGPVSFKDRGSKELTAEIFLWQSSKWIVSCDGKAKSPTDKIVSSQQIRNLAVTNEWIVTKAKLN